MLRLIVRRGLIFIPQLIGVTFVTFVLIRLLPGDPATQLAGVNATPENIEAIREQLQLNDSLLSQYAAYVKRLAQGDLGTSLVTFNSVTSDIGQRLPATLELVGLALALALVLAVVTGIFSAMHPESLIGRATYGYGMLAGALPDFFLGLLLSYLLFTVAGVLPSPSGQIDISLAPPDHVTGAYAVDALLTGNLEVLRSAGLHLVLPVATLVLVYAGVVMKQTRAAMERVLETPWMRFAMASGVSHRTIMRYGLRNVLPQVLTVTGAVLLFLIGGAVLVEQVFSWDGLGQYAVQAIQGSDYQAIQGFVLIAATISLVVNLLLDVLYALVDPRIRYAR